MSIGWNEKREHPLETAVCAIAFGLGEGAVDDDREAGCTFRVIAEDGSEVEVRLEPETASWRVVKRVSGATYGALEEG